MTVCDQNAISTTLSVPAPSKRHTCSTNLAIAEAIEINPVTGNRQRDKEFCNFKPFNRMMRKAYPALQRPLTHAQWQYLVTKANQEIGHDHDSLGHISIEAIFANQYALAVHHILVAYATGYGKSHGLTQLHSFNKNLHMCSEGELIAAEAAIEMVSPRITNRGSSQESITSKTIRNISEPAFITAEIKLRFANYIFREFDAYDRGGKINQLDRATEDESFNQESKDVHGLPEEYEKRKWHQINQVSLNNPEEFIRYSEVAELMQRVLHDLKAESDECINKGETNDIAVLSVTALQEWVDPHNAPIIANGESFLHQLCLVLKSRNLSRYHCKRIAEHIILKFRKILQIQVEEHTEVSLQPTNKATKSNWSNGKHPTHHNKFAMAAVGLVAEIKNQFSSPLITMQDQILLNKFLHHGHFFAHSKILLN